MKKWLLVIVLALLGGYLGYLSNFPLGTLLGSLFAVGSIQFVKKNLPIVPVNVKKAIQSVIGGSIGLAFTTHTFDSLTSIWKLAIIVPVLQILFAFVLTIILYKIFHFDIVTSFCSSAPAGMSEITIISEDYGANMPVVIMIHTVRVVVIVTGIPLIILLFQ
ncbi:AbrB family transcriptional regulator [Bacillaceae bacterium W0354]